MAVQVLVVEDNDALRGWLARVLDRAGYAVMQASSGEQALALLRQTGEYRAPFDVVLADIVMGEVSGVDIIEVARSGPEPPEVMLITSNADVDTAAAAVRLDAFDYLLKPVQPSLLVDRVAAAAQRRAERLRSAEEAAAWRSVAAVVSRLQPGAAPAETASTEEKSARYRVVGELRIDTQRREITFDGQRVAATPIEYTILNTLAETPSAVVTYGKLAQRTHAAVLDEREAYGLLRTHVRNLRRKIQPFYLVSVRGVGYMLDPAGQGDGDDE